MSNLFRSLSSLVGSAADAAPARAPTGNNSAPAPDDADEARTVARELPLVAYAPPQETPAPRPRSRSRTVGLLRSAASATAVTTRAEPTLPVVATRHAAHAAGPQLTETERVRLQVMQAQLQLHALRLYDGPIDGNMSPATSTAVRYFQTLKGIRPSGLLAAGTLAALGVPLIG
jgi:Putative peptidoglycan binding domain